VREIARYGLTACVAAAALCAVPSAAEAQQFSISRTEASTGIAEITGAPGWSVSVGFPAGLLRLGADVHQRSQTRSLETHVCTSYERGVGCRFEPTRRDAVLRGLGVAVAVPFAPVPQFSLEVGSGVTLNQVRADDRTESGRPNALFTSPTGQWGARLGMVARVRPLVTLPVSLHAGVGAHRIRMTSCGEYAWDDSPFCGTATIREFQIGASLDLGR
jgi:hypothetical protein